MIAIAIVPPIALIVFCVSAAAKWQSDAAKIRPMLEQWISPELIDAPAPAAIEYDARTSDEKTTQYRELNVAIDSVNDRYQILFDLLEEQADWTESLDQPQPTDKYVQIYLAEVQPLMNLAEQLSTSEDAIWMPHEAGNQYGVSNGLLLSGRSMFDMLRVEFRAAVRAKETTRAINAFRLSQTLVAPNAWVSNPLLSSVTDSFGTGIWNESEVGQLVQMIGNQSDADQAWQQHFRGVLLEQLPWLLEGKITDTWRRETLPVTFAPSRRIEWLENAGQLSRITQVGSLAAVKKVVEIDSSSHRESATKLDTALQIPVYGQLYVPSTSKVNLAKTFASEANDRRLARTAAALAVYKLKFDAYPNELAELTKVGLANDDMLDPTGETFRYLVQNQGCILGNASIWFRTSGGFHNGREDTLVDVLKQNREIHFR
ncbi:MAG: hypothetical protein KDB00_06715 [Planctomycetales bacterium]|nr:hypothetical protein [Planctomycetales bacterium]